MIRTYIKEIGLMFACAVIALLALYPNGPVQRLLVPAPVDANNMSPQLASQSYVKGGAQAPDASSSLPVSDDGKDSGGGIVNGAVSASGNGLLFHAINREPAPALALAGAMIADLDTGDTYYEKNADGRWPMASITKLLTADIASTYIPADTLITISPDIQVRLGADAGGQLAAGETYSASDLTRALLTFSSNEAAEALAGYIGRDAFIASMSATAGDWGLASTNISDPSGLSAANQSTPRDLLSLTRNVYAAYPSLFAITRAKGTTILDHASGKKTTYANINQFAGQPNFIGGKTGYTDEALGNLVSLFAYENRRVFVAVLGTEDRFGATQSLIDWFKRTHTMK